MDIQCSGGHEPARRGVPTRNQGHLVLLRRFRTLTYLPQHPKQLLWKIPEARTEFDLLAHEPFVPNITIRELEQPLVGMYQLILWKKMT